MNGKSPAHRAANARWEALRGTHVVPQWWQFCQAGLLRQHHVDQVPSRWEATMSGKESRSGDGNTTESQAGRRLRRQVIDRQYRVRV